MEAKSQNNKSKYFIESLTEKIFLISASVAVISLLLIIGFVFYKGLRPFIIEGYSFWDFIFGTQWIPSANKYGILPMIVASLGATIGALLIGVPVGILTSIFIAEIAPKKIAKIMSGAVELLAGIPSVLYGVFGLAIIVPTIQEVFNLPKGQSLLAVIIVLAIMMLPTVITVSETAIRAVPHAYKEGSLALGASKTETIFKVIVPAAKSGIMTGVVLGIGRAIGETMAVILVAGNTPVIPSSIMDSVRPLTTNIALEMGYAFGTHQEMLFATGVVLFTFILILNLVLVPINRIGIYGAIISSIISDIFIFAICFITLKKQITTKLYVSKYIVKPTIAGVFMSITSYIMYNNIINKIQNNIIVLFVSIFSGMMVYFILIIALKILTEEEIYMLPYGQKLFRTFKSKKQQMQVKSTHTELPKHGNLRGKRVCKKIKIKKEGF